MEQSSVLPDQIIIDEILIRLPVKSLCRFKAVSKLWNAVISSYPFAKAHLNYDQNNSNSKWAFVQHDQNSWLLDYEAYDHKDPVAVDDEDQNDAAGGVISLGEVLNFHMKGVKEEPFGSSCGLVSFLRYDGQIYICNPILRQCQVISTPDLFDVMNLIFYGFGYVSSIDEFKLVLALGDSLEGHKAMIYVFSLRNNTWRVIQGCHQFGVLVTSFHLKEGMLVNECLHWWATKTGDSNHGRIFAFDLLHERFEEIPIPKKLSSMTPNIVRSSGVSTMGGYLCLSIYDEETICIWMLKEYGRMESWEELYYFYSPSVLKYHHDKFFGFTKNGKFLICCLANCFELFILVEPYKYLPNHKPIEGINLLLPGFKNLEGFGGDINYVINFVESLISPLGFTTST